MKTREWSFGWIHKNRVRLEVGCSLHPTMKSYLEVSPSKQHQSSIGCFYAANSNGLYVGKIHLIEGLPNFREVVIHEAFHAAFECQRHLGRSVPDRFEEAVVQCGSSLADEMLSCLDDPSI